MPIKNDIICFCGQDWWYHNRAHSDFQLMTRAAKDRKVLLINSIGMRMPMPGRSSLPLRRIWRKLKSIFAGVQQPVAELPNYTVMTPVLFPFYGNAWARAFNAWSIRIQVERQARKLGILKPSIIITVPTAWEIASKMNRSSIVYNRSDKHSDFGEADGNVIASLEQELLTKADGVIYCCRALQDEERKFTGSRSRFMDHGVDIHHFAPRLKTNELIKLGCKRPIIGFFGSLDDYIVDFDLLERIAKERPDYSLVLIGDSTLSLDRLTKFSNVFHLGFRPYDEIPSLGADFDVSIMPWLDNEWIRNCNPIKLKEYLSLGQEVLSTYFPELEYYTDYVHISRDRDEFMSLLDEIVIGRKTPGDRRALLKNASWDDRSKELLTFVDSIEPEIPTVQKVQHLPTAST